MSVVEVQNVSKAFNGQLAVDRLSLAVEPGEIFGLLGPNGAGKTTTIRMLMDIIKPDAGTIRVLGHPPGHEVQDRVGYLPEERGLYRNLKVMECLAYLAALKGVGRGQTSDRAGRLLASVGLEAQARSKVRALSKGMQQKLQFVATVLHDPDVVILDEPFQGLDPISTEQIKGLISDLRERGKAIVLSTHMMNQVERLCDRILLIDEGKRVLYGPLEEIKAQYAQHALLIRSPYPVNDLPGARQVGRRDQKQFVVLDDAVSPQDILRELVERRIPLTHFEVVTPPLEDIFIRVVEGCDA